MLVDHSLHRCNFIQTLLVGEVRLRIEFLVNLIGRRWHYGVGQTNLIGGVDAGTFD
jgi:hypothetical protein